MSNTDTRFQGRIISVRVENVTLPNGVDLAMEIVEHPGGAAVVAVDERGRVCLVHQYRHVFGRWLWELPAGKRDNQEDPRITAERELQEEVGVVAVNWTELGEVISSPGVFSEIVYVYLAQGLRSVDRALEEHEVLEVHWLEFEQALAMARSGEINDSKTVVGLFRAAALL